LTEIQLLAIPRILGGTNVVIAAPTASGKTEAIVAPLAEKVATEVGVLSIVYAVPTRALANDTLLRVEGPLSDLGISVALKHGDHPTLPRELPGLLITTPESLDSLICRKPEIFDGLRALALDEIHLVDGTYRGDQLRILLRRLQQLTAAPFEVHLLSATLAEPREIGGRYIDGHFEVVVAPGQRQIERAFVSSLEEVRTVARREGHRKLLFFCNRRRSVESLASELELMWRPYPVVAHHGSLSRHEREVAEQVMQESRIAVCVATSTLEIGIDIGDVDLVVLADPPWSISALLQRIGRGNRRSGVTRVIAIAESDDERSLLEAMFDAAASGAIPSPDYSPDLSVVVQQTFSVLFGKRDGLSQTQLYELVSPLCDAEQLGEILSHLNDLGWLLTRSGLWFPTTKLLDYGERGSIHVNIPDTASHRVIDVGSGREVGTIGDTFDQVFVLGRRKWQVVHREGNLIHARAFAGAASPPHFRRSSSEGKYDPLLPPGLRHKQD
jgi:ATP-dependent Lhr-like helicase